MRQFLITCAVAALVALPLSAAGAQQMKRPIDFDRSSLGMSQAYKQAYLNAEINGVRPDNLLRGANGRLLTVTEGPDGSALVRSPGASYLPARRGSALSVGGVGVGLGVPDGTDAPAVGLAPTGGGSTVGGWTNLVHGLAPGRGSPVNQWISQTQTLPPRTR